jgi:hypothetical protein
MSKWTDWIPHEGDECPVANDEKMKLRFEGNPPEYYTCVIRPTSLGWSNSPCRHARITHYKRLRKNVEAERVFALRDCNFKTATETASARENFQAIADDLGTLKDRHETRRGPFVVTDEDIDATTPKPIITGPGEYVTRKGEKIIISEKGRLSGWLGSFPWTDNLASWNSDGSYSMAAFPIHDITGPWQEPEKPERWENLYRSDSGELHMSSCFYTSFKSAKLNAGSVFKHIGAVLLNPEEE